VPKAVEPVRVRTLFLSDVHLGTRGCQASLLLDFLKRYDADTIYLVGDIIDGWRLKSGWYWPQSHNDVIQKLLRKVRKGARLVYIPGDQFDLVVRHARWLALLGDGAYTVALAVNTHLNAVRRRLGLTYWSLSAWAKLKVKNAVNYIGRFEEFLVGEAKRHEVDGVICGHIHHPAMHDLLGILYVNTGDWVESCTATVEHYDGRLEMIRWADAGCKPIEAVAADALPEKSLEAA
jgi:UDP-2,3-diacylglucosamine pyrophosphatase LpxH